MVTEATTVEECVSLVEEHRMLVCRLCKSAVRPGPGIRSHFRGHRVKGQLFADIRDYYETAQLSDPLSAKLPEDKSAPIAPLPKLRGYSCKYCRFLTISRDSIQKHQRTAKHASGQAAQPNYAEVQLQSWLSNKGTRYWIVEGVGGNGAGALREDVPQDSKFDEMVNEFAAEIKTKHDEWLRRGDIEEGIDRDSSWVKRLKWVRHFGSRDKIHIFEAAEWVNSRQLKDQDRQDEAAAREALQLKELGASFDREIERCCWRLDNVPVETLQLLASISPTALTGTPFGRKSTEDSMKKYRSIGHRYLGFCLRAYRLGREEAWEKLAIRFTDEQWSLLRDVVHVLDSEGISSSDDSGIFSQDDEDGGEEGEEEEEEEEGEEYWEDEAKSSKARLDEEALDRAIFLFLVSSIKQNVGGDVYTNPLLCFCAALGIRKSPLGFTEPQLYTGLLAGVMWWTRLVFLEAVFENQGTEIEDITVEAALRFKEEHGKWMCINTFSMVSTIIGWMAYGKGQRNKTGGQATVRWSEDGRSLFHDGEEIRIDDFKRAMRGMVHETEGFLDQLMAGTWADVSPQLDLKRIADSMVRVGAGQSFATNPKNGWLEAGPGKVMRLARRALWDGEKCRWKPQAAKKRLRWLRQFRERLMGLVHIWAGQAGRGMEMTSMRHCDSWQLMRNVFVLDGQVMLVTDRDKAKAIRDNGRKVARFLPDRIGKMVVAYVAWLLPFERMLRAKCKLPEPRESMLEFMWRDGSSGVWETERLSRILAQTTQAATGVRLGTARYRVVSIEIGRRIQGLIARQVESQMEDDDGGGHIDIDPVTGDAVDCSGTWNIVWDLQSTHGTRIARQHYAVHIGYPGRLQPEMIATYREISRLWHQFLEHDGEGQGGAKRRAETADGQGERKRIRLEAEAGETEEELAGGLCKLLGAGATWRSEKQAESMKTVMALGRDQTAISVLPTGAGKSILFMLPAVLRDGGTSIVVVPFVALKGDIVSRAVAMGVDCIAFESSLSVGRESVPRAARLVVVSADIVGGSEFRSYADGLLCAGLLRRLFVDECHTAITDVSYRARLAEVKTLHRYRCPVVLLTATLPVVLEDWFRRALLAEDAVMVRDRTTKLNCRYRVEQVARRKGGRDGDAVEERTVEMVRELSRQMTGKQKGVVYCRSKEQSETLADEIGCDCHHSDMPEQDRREAREEWAGGKGHRWIVATTGLGTGIDMEGIVAVVHAEAPYGLVDFVQQTGRGARRPGEVVESVIVHDGRAPWVDRHQSFVDESNQSQIRAFMSTPGCRRAVIGAFMDGVAGEVCADVAGAEPCDRCRSDGGLGMSKWQAFGRREGRQVRMLQRWLDEVAEECAVCHVMRHHRGLEQSFVPDTPRHAEEGEWCRVVDDDEQYALARREMVFGKLSCCFVCKLPLKWCEQTREGEAGAGAGSEARCGYKDKVLPVVLMATKLGWVTRLARDQFGVDAKDRAAFYTWAGRNRDFHGTKGTNALALWEAIVEEAYKGGRYWFT